MNMHYQDVTIEVTGESVTDDAGRRVGRYRVRVLQSPAGEQAADEATAIEFAEKELVRSLDRLELRELGPDDLIALGRTLAALLLPVARSDERPSVRELFARSLAALPPETGLRLRLRLPRELSVIPWEYAYVERAGGAGMDGFLALDPRVAFVRHEQLTAPVQPPRAAGDIKVVAALASAPDLPELDLEAELTDIREALRDVTGLTLEAIEHATLAGLQPVLEQAAIFHFAGHGDFAREMGARPGTYQGTGLLAFEDQRVPAEQLALNLRGNGVQLAVLGGCRTARRDGVSVWSGIAPALVKAEIPAVLANQYTIADKTAIAFSRSFYLALAGGAPIERAVTAGRIAAYNADPESRDWGVPVLYLRAGDGELFAGVSDPEARARALDQAEADVRVRTGEVEAGALLLGAQVEELLSGKLAVAVKVDGTVFGNVVGARMETVGGGETRVDVGTGKVGSGGSVIGAVIGGIGRKIGGAAARARSAPAPASAPASAPPRETPRPTHAKPPGSMAEPPAPPSPSAPPSPAAASEPAGAAAEPPESPPAAEAAHPAEAAEPPVSGAAPTDADEAATAAPAEASLTRTTTRISVSTGEVHDGQVIGAQYNDSHEISQISAGTVNIYQGGVAPGSPHTEGPVVEEQIRLDVAVPRTAKVERAFKIFVAVKQPDAPPLTAGDLEQVASQAGQIFREQDEQVVKYRVEVTGDGFRVTPPFYVFRLRPGQNSAVIAFQAVAAEAGKRSLFVNAYQEEGAVPELIAQTVLEIEVEIAITDA